MSLFHRPFWYKISQLLETYPKSLKAKDTRKNVNIVGSTVYGDALVLFGV